jgi:hypothetical protein
VRALTAFARTLHNGAGLKVRLVVVVLLLRVLAAVVAARGQAEEVLEAAVLLEALQLADLALEHRRLDEVREERPRTVILLLVLLVLVVLAGSCRFARVVLVHVRGVHGHRLGHGLGLELGLGVARVALELRQLRRRERGAGERLEGGARRIGRHSRPVGQVHFAVDATAQLAQRHLELFLVDAGLAEDGVDLGGAEVGQLGRHRVLQLHILQHAVHPRVGGRQQAVLRCGRQERERESESRGGRP